MRAIVSVIGKDQVGIIANVCSCSLPIRSMCWTSARPCFRITSP